MSLPKSLLLLLVVLLLPTLARAELAFFDFENEPAYAGMTSFTVASNGLQMTITRSSGITFDLDSPNVSPFGARSLSPFNGENGAAVADTFQVELSQAVTYISVDFGDFGGDADGLYLEAYVGSGLTGNYAADQGSLAGGGSAFVYDQLAVSGNAFAPEFRSFYIRGGGNDFPNSVYYDNFTFEFTPVPEPSSLSLSLVAVGWLLTRRRRRS